MVFSQKVLSNNREIPSHLVKLLVFCYKEKKWPPRSEGCRGLKAFGIFDWFFFNGDFRRRVLEECSKNVDQLHLGKKTVQ